MNLGQRKDAIVFVLIIVLAVMIGRNGVYQYNLSKINFTKSKVEEEKKKNEMLGFIGILDRRLDKYRVRSYLAPEITQLIDRISHLAKTSGVRVETFEPRPAVHRQHYIELLIEIPLKSDFHRLGKLLSLIESNQEFIQIKELRIEKPTVIDPNADNIPRVILVVSGIHLKK